MCCLKILKYDSPQNNFSEEEITKLKLIYKLYSYGKFLNSLCNSLLKLL